MKYFLDTEFHEYKKKPLFGRPIDTIELISIGIASEDNRTYYAICKEFDIKAAWKNKWLKENVLYPIFKDLLITNGNEIVRTGYSTKQLCDRWDLEDFISLISEYGKTREQIAKEIKEFIFPGLMENANPLDHYNKPTFYAYYADYDWVVFCWLFGRMIDLPKGFPMYCKDLKQILDTYVEDRWLPASREYTERKDLGFDEALEKLKELEDYPTQLNEHDALDDALFNKRLHHFLQSL